MLNSFIRAAVVVLYNGIARKKEAWEAMDIQLFWSTETVHFCPGAQGRVWNNSLYSEEVRLRTRTQLRTAKVRTNFFLSIHTFCFLTTISLFCLVHFFYVKAICVTLANFNNEKLL